MDENGTLDPATLLVRNPGTGYEVGDLVLVQATKLYEVNKFLNFRAGVSDPLGELAQVVFYGNGVPLIGSSSVFGGEATLTHIPTSERLSFVNTRALYGDGRDNPPTVMPSGGFVESLQESAHTTIGQHSWGWRRNWEQQHMHRENYPAPAWFWSNIHDYWTWPPS